MDGTAEQLETVFLSRQNVQSCHSPGMEGNLAETCLEELFALRLVTKATRLTQRQSPHTAAGLTLGGNGMEWRISTFQHAQVCFTLKYFTSLACNTPRGLKKIKLAPLAFASSYTARPKLLSNTSHAGGVL